MNNEFAYTALSNWGFWEKRKYTKFYTQFVGNSDLVFTIGDSAANASELFLKFGAFVVAVEPLPECVQYVTNRIQKYDKKVFLHEDIGAFNAEFAYSEAYERKILPYSSNLTVSEDKSLVKITTIDELIHQYGIPAFCKINANGFETEVLKGLSVPILAISLGFYSYLHEKTIEIVRRVLELGDYEFNWKLVENTDFKSKKWLTPKELHTSMNNYGETRFAGEIFARLR